MRPKRARQEAAADRHAALVADLRRAVLESSGTADPAVRAAAASPDGRAGELPALLASYAAKVASESYRITDADFATLMAQGHGEQEIVEVTVSAALGAALRRLDAGLRAVREGS